MTLPVSRSLSPETLHRVIQEAALGFYAPEEIARLLGVEQDLVTRALNHPSVRAEIDKAQRVLVEEGTKFRLWAKQLAEQVLMDVAKVATDPAATTADKLKAADLLIRSAGFMPKEAAGAAVQVNLTLAPKIEEARSRAEPYLTLVAEK